MIKLIDILEESIFDFFSKKQPEPTKRSVAPPPPPKKKELIINELPITIEGISNDGQGYTVWAGNDPMGDMRQQFANKGGSGYGEMGNKAYYYVSDLTDHVGRSAYFMVSTPKSPKAKQVIEKVANAVLKSQQRNGINAYNLTYVLKSLTND